MTFFSVNIYNRDLIKVYYLLNAKYRNTALEYKSKKKLRGCGRVFGQH